ncbi:MAG: N-acetyltransferase [Moorea sp. SIO1G6]|nr:N-acetyltransferase [Moorena sp. SIO4E2]NET67194.1 N-acetyltransferase [Moorena sp. SIO1G6]
MKPHNMIIRDAEIRDRESVRSLHMSAFPTGEGDLVASLADDLISNITEPCTLSLVAVDDNKIIGNVAYSPVFISEKQDFHGYILAPLAVKPECQGNGIGSELIDAGIKRLRSMNVNIVFVYGDPRYYQRFGFKAELATHFIPPYPLQWPFGWQALLLREIEKSGAAVNIKCVKSLNNPKLW